MPVASSNNKVPTLPNISTPERNKKKKKKHLSKQENGAEKSKNFSSSADKQMFFKEFSIKFSLWKTWQKKIFLCKCTTESSLNLLFSLSTILEPVFHRDFQVIHLGGFKSSLIKNFSDLNQKIKNEDEQVGASSEKLYLPELENNASNSKDTKGIANPFLSTSIEKNQDARMSNKHIHYRERHSESLSTIDFIHDYQKNQLKTLGSLFRHNKRKSHCTLLSEYKHKSWWSPSELRLENVSKITLLQSFKEVLEGFYFNFVKWSNAEQGDFFLTIFQYCSPEELIFLANCIQQRLKDIKDINRLPDKLMLNIFSYLDVNSLLKCSQVCKCWRLLAKNNTLWKERTYTLADKYKQNAILNYMETISRCLIWSEVYKELNDCIQQLVIESTNSITYSVKDDEENEEYFEETETESEDGASVEESCSGTVLDSSLGMSDIVHLKPVRTFSPVTNTDLFPSVEEDVSLNKEEIQANTKEKEQVVEEIQNTVSIEDPAIDFAFDVRPKLEQPTNELVSRSKWKIVKISFS